MQTIRKAKDERMYNQRKERLSKPIIERQRRERINRSIDRIKDLLIDNEMRKENGRKLERADILDIAVEFIERILFIRVADCSSNMNITGRRNLTSEMSANQFQSEIIRKSLNEDSSSCSISSTVSLTNDDALQNSPVDFSNRVWQPWQQ